MFCPVSETRLFYDVIVISCNQPGDLKASYRNGLPKLRRSPGLVTNGLKGLAQAKSISIQRC